jgi:LmbE family N-acetylglucosaminyl deacetylase
MKLLERNPSLRVTWVVLTSDEERGAEALAGAHAVLDAATNSNIVIKDFRVRFLPYDGAAVKTYFDELKGSVTPDLIFTHYRHDLHQDHRLVSELTWNTFRDQLILEYEIPKFDGDFGAPNVFVHLDEDLCRRKIGILLDCFPSQRERPWFSEEVFRSVLRLRGMESNAPDRCAEAFYCRKLVLL